MFPYEVYHSVDDNFAIQEGKWKLESCSGSGGLEYPKNKQVAAKGLPSVQLYNMETDIGEKSNVELAYPDIVVRLLKDLEACVSKGRSTPGLKESNTAGINIWKLPAMPVAIEKLLQKGG